MRRVPILVACVGLVLCAGSSFAGESPLSDAEIVAWLSDELKEMAATGNFSGVMLIARDEKVLLHEAYGLTSRRYNVPNSVETRFNLASASKMFTGVAVAKLAEEGRLSLEDPIGRYLDAEWVSETVGKKVKISHLLNHTSGLGHFWEGWDEQWPKIRTLADYRPIISDELAFEPGADWQYSNSGYLLLGIIIEKVTGEDFFEHVQRTILQPSGMNKSGFFEMDLPHQNLAVGYWEDKEDGGRLKNNTLFLGYRGSSAGGAWTTAADLHRFVLALQGDKLVSRETRELLWSPTTTSPKYGYGFQTKNGWVGHTGGFDGFESYLYHFPESGHTFILFANYYDSGYPLAIKIRELYPRLIP